jgi:hypothetical protein
METMCIDGYCLRPGSPFCGVPPGADAAVDASSIVDATVDAVEPDAMPSVFRDCREALELGAVADGVRMIDPDGAGGSDPFQAYCDQTTDGGGWTLVYVYTFTNYSNFTAQGNAVTPRPSWPYSAGGTSTPVSTALPLAPTTLGALEFARWPQLGGEFLVTSNINHWVSCHPMTGDLTGWSQGNIDCTLVRLVATACTNVTPNFLRLDPQGPSLQEGSNFYYLEANTQNNWPTHDPCGNNAQNQLTGISNPGGAVFLRRSP